MKTSKLIEIASRFGYKAERSETGIGFVKNKIDVLNGVELTGSHYMVSDSLPAQLAHAIIDYANTPVEKREDRWNVVIARELTEFQVLYTIWSHVEDKQRYYPDFFVNNRGLKARSAVFTDSEFDGLIIYLKSIPDGDTYAKIAELGKREVKS